MAAGLHIATTLRWEGDLRFAAESGPQRITLDSENAAGPSPMVALAMGLAGCMAIDVVDILRKGRHPLTGLEAALEGERKADPPRRFVRVDLRYTIRGAVPVAAVERAIQLSRDRYCSVWHSLQPDIAFTTSFEVHP